MIRQRLRRIACALGEHRWHHAEEIVGHDTLRTTATCSRCKEGIRVELRISQGEGPALRCIRCGGDDGLISGSMPPLCAACGMVGA